MSHPLKDYVRGVQDELARDGKKPAYMWCLREVEKAIEHAKAMASIDVGGPAVDRRAHKAATIVRLIEAIRPLAEKGGS
jgi:hypothetical protein